MNNCDMLLEQFKQDKYYLRNLLMVISEIEKARDKEILINKKEVKIDELKRTDSHDECDVLQDKQSFLEKR